MTFKVTGTAGHGSLTLINTAGEKMRRLIDRVMDYREQQVNKLSLNPSLTVGDITFVNMTMMGVRFKLIYFLYLKIIRGVLSRTWSPKHWK